MFISFLSSFSFLFFFANLQKKNITICFRNFLKKAKFKMMKNLADFVYRYFG